MVYGLDGVFIEDSFKMDSGVRRSVPELYKKKTISRFEMVELVDAIAVFL